MNLKKMNFLMLLVFCFGIFSFVTVAETASEIFKNIDKETEDTEIQNKAEVTDVMRSIKSFGLMLQVILTGAILFIGLPFGGGVEGIKSMMHGVFTERLKITLTASAVALLMIWLAPTFLRMFVG